MIRIGPVQSRYDERLSIDSPFVKDPKSPLFAEMIDSLNVPSENLVHAEIRKEVFYHLAGSLPRAKCGEIFFCVMKLQSEGLRIPIADGLRFAQRAIIRLELSLLIRYPFKELSREFEKAWLSARIAYPLLETCYVPALLGSRPIPIFDYQEAINQQYLALYEGLLPVKDTLYGDERVTLHRIEEYLEKPIESFCELVRERMAYLILQGQKIEEDFDSRRVFE